MTMTMNSKQDLIHCDKCGTLIDKDNVSSIQPLCSKCEVIWTDFFNKYYLKIETEFNGRTDGYPNPTWYVFLGLVESEHVKIKKPIFMFR